jgi:ribosomal protein S18 acetylase RimI-like enzyme
LQAIQLTMPDTRRAGLADAAPLAALAERTFRATFSRFNTRENMNAHCARTYGEAIQAREIADPAIETFVCDDGVELAGYAQLRWGTAPPCVPASQPAEIQRIYVEQRWQGKGVAQALMSRLLAAATRGGADQLWLGVWENNPRAIAYYQKVGFTKVGHHVFQLGDDPQHDWIMCRDVRSGRPGT